VRLARVEQLAGADREHLTPLRLLLGGVRKDDSASRLLLRLDLLDHDAVLKWANLLLGHGVVSCFLEIPRRVRRLLLVTQ